MRKTSLSRYARTACLSLTVALAACDDPVAPARVVHADLRTQSSAAAAAGLSRYIVSFRDDTPDVHALAANLVAGRGGRLRFVYRHAIKGFAADLPPAAASALRRHPAVLHVEDDPILTLSATQSPTPNWGLDRIDQREASLNNSFFYERTGAGVHYYSIDSGILLDHNDLAGRVSTGWDIVVPGGDANDCNGHGTHTTTIAAGTTYGVAKGMTVHPVRIADCAGNWSPSTFVAGADSVIVNKILPAVVNASLGGPVTAAIDNAVNNMIANGIVVVVSAGNEGQNACNKSPARVPNALTVAASDANDDRAIFTQLQSSNFGSCVDLFAPGKDILAGWEPNPGSTAIKSGTSMAAPHVAGTAGLWLEGFPTSTPAQVAAQIVNYATANVIHDTQGSPNKLLWMRFANLTPTADFTEFCSAGGWCQFYGYPSVDDVGIVEYFWTFNDAYPPQDYGSSVSTDFYGSGFSEVTLRVTDGGGRQHSVSKWVSYY
jgi:subtilisin family serine protease